MELFILFTLLVFSVETKLTKRCDGEIVHDSEVIKTGINSPYQLAIDYDTNTLFFSYTSDNNGESKFETAYINLVTKEFNNVKGIKGGFANAVDAENHIVYFGGENGIYTFDYNSKDAKHIDGTNHTIWQLFFKKQLYYTIYPEEEVYIFNKGKAERLPELRQTKGMLVALDNNDNIYFYNSTGLYVFEKTNKSITLIGEYVINGLTNDKEGNIFFSTTNGIFYIDDKQKTAEKLISMDDIYGFAIDNDGSIICSLEESIVKLKQC